MKQMYNFPFDKQINFLARLKGCLGLLFCLCPYIGFQGCWRKGKCANREENYPAPKNCAEVCILFNAVEAGTAVEPCATVRREKKLLSN